MLWVNAERMLGPLGEDPWDKRTPGTPTKYHPMERAGSVGLQSVLAGATPGSQPWPYPGSHPRCKAERPPLVGLGITHGPYPAHTPGLQTERSLSDRARRAHGRSLVGRVGRGTKGEARNRLGSAYRGVSTGRLADPWRAAARSNYPGQKSLADPQEG